MDSPADDGSQTLAIQYRPDIDGLRAIAIVSVILCHADLGLQGGYVGVDVFFVISGYLITSLILKRVQQSAFSLVEFWERRIRRILPVLVTVTALTLIAGFLILLPNDLIALGKSLIALGFSVPNVYFWREIKYFDPLASEKYLLHTWSLAVEEQFYLILPLFLYVAARLNRLTQGFVLLSVIAVLSFVLSIYGAFHFPRATFYLLPTRAWELLLGSLLARFPMRLYVELFSLVAGGRIHRRTAFDLGPMRLLILEQRLFRGSPHLLRCPARGS